MTAIAKTAPGPDCDRLARLRRLGGARTRLLETSAGSPVHWRLMAGLYAMAGLAVLTTVALGVDDGAHPEAVALLGATALLAGVALFALAPLLRSHSPAPALIGGLALVGLTVFAAGEADTPYALLYVWFGVEAWLFLQARQALALTAATVASSALVMFALVPDTGGDALRWWAMVMASLLTISGVASVLHGRAALLVDQLDAAARHDPLTRLLNRRGYAQRLHEEVARARRYGTPLSIVLADIDNFKQLNDRFGHRAGDAALCDFADLCRTQLRDVDFVSRVGGEEFAIVLPHTDERGAVLAAERLRRAVAGGLRISGGPAVTASFGVAAFPQHGTDAEVLLDHADQAMYTAKRSGRNRTVVFTGEAPGQELQPVPDRSSLEAVLLLAEALDLRDAATGSHSQTVGLLAAGTARALGLAADRIERVRLAGLLHDVGKIGVPDDILRKAGPLTPEEWQEMRKHPELGARIVEAAGLPDIAAWVLAHHERPDGGGYPLGLAADAIPLEAQILAVADAYEAMTADRPYRNALPLEVATAELERCAGTQFDPRIVAAFLEHVGAGERAPALAA